MKTLGEWAVVAGGDVRGDERTPIERVAAVDDSDARTLTFAVEAKYLASALASAAGAVLVDAKLAEAAGAATKPLVIVPNVRAALIPLLRALEPPLPRGPFRHATAAVDPTASIGPDVYVGPHVAIGSGAVIGANCVLLAGAVVGENARLGASSLLHPRAMLLDRCVAGDRVVLHPGAVVGSDGFGFALAGAALTRIPQIGNVELGDDVEIGANACVDRAQTGTTRIGHGTKIDNLVQIGHNCRIGSNCALAAQTGLAGSTILGDYVEVGGQSAFAGHLTVGSRVRIAGHSGVWNDIPDGSTISGDPARDHRAELRHKVRLRDLDKLFERVDKIERNRPT
jgi:UDP-3-O-[3-hydroxymyristoyl] glucosamine N-acyltransferase